MKRTWDSVKQLVNGKERINLQAFSDYIDYLSKGAIVRKIGIMGHLPKNEKGKYPFLQ